MIVGHRGSEAVMMELSHSLTLNEEALAQLPAPKRPVFIFEWLRFLDKVLVAAQKADIKECQKKLVEQLLELMSGSPGPPTRKLIARCLATLFSVGDTFLLFETVNKCNDIIKNKDDSPSFLPTRLAAICCVGYMYEKLGRMMGRSYEETVQILIKALKNAESHTRMEIMTTFEKVCAGMGSAISNVHKDMYKAARLCLADRVMGVRSAAAQCLGEMMKHSPSLLSSELENMAALCFRAFDGCNYDVRCSVAKLLGTLVAQTQLFPKNAGQQNNGSKGAVKSLSLDEALGILMTGFLRGGHSFLKGTGEIIKGTPAVNREVRVGVTHAYVVMVQVLGASWLERNLPAFLTHVLDLAANPKAASSHVDAVYSRKCINFILRSVLGRMLGEKAQASACKEITLIVAKQMNSIDFNPENAKDCNQETLFSQHLLACSLLEIGSLVTSLGTVAQNLVHDASLKLVETVCQVLGHPCQAARLAAAWCLRCVCVAVPSQTTPLIDRCVENLDNLKASPEIIGGYSCALAAVLGGIRNSPLGVPHTKGKIIFNTGEELLRSASQNSRLSLARTQAGWLLIGGIMSLGVGVVRGLLPRMLLLWRNSFPRSNKELESEKARGDAFTWQVTLEGRAGALSAMHSFIQSCPELVTDDITRRLVIPIESALAMLTNISTVLKNYGQNLKAPAAIVRLRLYETLSLLPPNACEGSYTHLLRMLVAEFTLAENPGNTTTSLLRGLCHAEDSVILGTWLQDTDHHTIEDQLHSNSAAGSGALEHDPCTLYRPTRQGEYVPGPLPLGVGVIDQSLVLFGLIFPRVANKHRLQVLEHFTECVRHAKASRQEAVQMNVLTALLSALRGLTDAKAGFGQDEIQAAAAALVNVGASRCQSTLTSANASLRCAAAECLGKMAQVVADARFTANQAQTSFDRLKLARDAASRTGHSLALGCLHRYVGGMGSSQHLNTSVSILLALAQDTTSPVVQVWALHALSLIAESGGPMFRGYVEPSLSLSVKLLLTVPESNVDVHQCIGKVLSALITTVGPELQGNTTSICMARSSFLCACAIMQDHADPLVQSEAISALQQLHLFAPRHANLSSLVPTLCRALSSHHLLLRKAAVSCLRQLSQREAREVCEHAVADPEVTLPDAGLPGVLFAMLDTETDLKLQKEVHDTITSMLQVLAADNLSQWLRLCKDVLTVSTESEEPGTLGLDDGDEDGEDCDQADLGAGLGTQEQTHPAVQPRWPTRVFAAECVRRLIVACRASKPEHFDMALAKDMQLTKTKGDYLVLHVSDLVRMAFMAATSDSDPLRLEGLKTLEEIISQFCNIPEPEFPGHLLLEQFQAQVGAALRPAFALDTSAHVTAAACEVCSRWIGCGVARDLNDLRRVHQLLVAALARLNRPAGVPIYNESVSTLEKLAILKAWAEVYIVAMERGGSAPYSVATPAPGGSLLSSMASSSISTMSEDDCPATAGGNLLALVQPELTTLPHHWLAALRDHALLSLPPEFSSQLPHEGGALYTSDTMELSRAHYLQSWPPLLLAAALWLHAGGLETPPHQHPAESHRGDVSVRDSPSDRFHLLFGISLEAMCSTRTQEPTETIVTCLRALFTLLETWKPREMLLEDTALAVELCNVLHRMVLTREDLEVHKISMRVLKLVTTAVAEKLSTDKRTKLRDVCAANQDTEESQEADLAGEGGASGEITPGKSVVFAVLEVCLCLLVRHLPSLNPTPLVSTPLRSRPLSPEADQLVATALDVMASLPDLCSPQGALAILPTILYLTTGVVKETSSQTGCVAVTAGLRGLKAVAQHRFCTDERSSAMWQKLLQSTLASIVGLSKDSDSELLQGRTLLLSIGVFVLNAPAAVVMAPTLQYPCINHFQRSLQGDDMEVKIECLETLRRVFRHPERTVAAPYIHALAPRVLEVLYSEPSRRPAAPQELRVAVESIRTVETLVGLAQPVHRVEMLQLLVPILVGCLIDGPLLAGCDTLKKALHDHCLQTLVSIGPQYPEEFKSLMSQSTDLRRKLETAVRNSQQPQVRPKNENSAPKVASVQAPTIKLKTDFSHFTR